MTPAEHDRRNGEDGYLLLWLVVVCFLLLLALSVAAPRVAKELERDREVESEHRAQEYVRAIQLYYKRTNTYPTSIEQLLGSGPGGGPSALNVKYLRQQYKDPLTRGDFRLIHLGEAKTEVKGFFGEPLQGIPTSNIGASAGSPSNMSGGSNFGSPSPGFGSSPQSGAAGSPAGTIPGTPGAAAPTTNAGTPPATDAGGTTPAPTTTGASGSTPFGGTGTSATSFQGSKGGIVGVGSNAKGQGLVEWNGSENIEDWEFLYDPRVEILKAKVSLFGGGPPTAGSSGSLGSGSMNSTAAPGTFGSSPGASSPTGTPSTGTPNGSTPAGAPTGTNGTTPQ